MTAARFESDLFALALPAHQGAVDQVGEWAFENSAGDVLPKFTGGNWQFTRALMATARTLVMQPPPAYTRLATSATGAFVSGNVDVSVSLRGELPTRVFGFPLTAARYIAGRYAFTLGPLNWRLLASAFVVNSNLRHQPITPDRPPNARYFVDLSFVVNATRLWAALIDTSSYQGGVVGEGVQSRQYRVRQTDVAHVHNELTDGDGKWDIVGIEPDGRRRFLNIDCQQFEFSSTTVSLNAA